MLVKGNHPLAEIIARKLFGIAPFKSADETKMISRAIKAAVKYHEDELKKERRKFANEILKKHNINLLSEV